ncbi:MAG TPA: hypothetical protein VKN18_06265 [Blastocatellia bacterium]|nr:hypothetical protein [Blastocatellia bacterium]
MKFLRHQFVLLFILVVSATQVFAQQDSGSVKTPLIRLLQSKGIITEQEAATVSDASSPAEAEHRLAELLLSKGMITRQEYDQALASARVAPVDSSSPRAITAGVHIDSAEPAKAAPATTMVAKGSGAAQSQAQGEVTTTSKLPLKISGSILFNANYVDRGANTIDIPLFPQKRTVSEDQDHQNFNATLRQTRFGLRYEGSIFNDAKLIGVFEFDLLGGKPAFANGVNFDIFRVRLAYGRVDWKKDSFEAGQDWAVFSPLNPTSLASYAIPAFSTSGNLWNRMPQIRYEHREGDKSKFIFTTALLDPNAGDSSGNPAVRVIGLGERGSLPAFEMRVGWSGSMHGKESSVGVSGHYSRLLAVPGNPAGTTVRSPIDSYGVSGDANVWLSSGIRVTGEVFHGRALEIFSGDVAQLPVVIDGRARGINSTGGWVELHAEAPTNYEGTLKNLSANFGYGIEDGREQDLIVGLRKRNQAYMVNGRYNFTASFATGLEYRRILTDWFREPASNSNLNWVGLSFLFSF